MQHRVIREDNGHYLDGRYREAAIEAVMRDVTVIEIGGRTMEIISHTVDADGNKVTKVSVDA